MRWVRAVSAAGVALAASLLLALVHPFGNAGLFATRSAQGPLLEGSSVPAGVRDILVAKCANCHSEKTHSPVYGHFAPMSWLMERDIVEARKAMDLSRWNTYSADEQATYAAKMAQMAKSGRMPPLQYRMIHWTSRTTPADIAALATWARGADPGDNGGPASGAGDPNRGQALFQKRCTGCHSLTQNREGPQLQGVYGRVTGSVAKFPYSDALRKANIVWNDQTLEKWLTDPDTFLPGNNMDFHVPRPQEREDIIAFLKRSSGA